MTTTQLAIPKIGTNRIDLGPSEVYFKTNSKLADNINETAMPV